MPRPRDPTQWQGTWTFTQHRRRPGPRVVQYQITVDWRHVYRRERVLRMTSDQWREAMRLAHEQTPDPDELPRYDGDGAGPVFSPTYRVPPRLLAERFHLAATLIFEQAEKGYTPARFIACHAGGGAVIPRRPRCLP